MKPTNYAINRLTPSGIQLLCCLATLALMAAGGCAYHDPLYDSTVMSHVTTKYAAGPPPRPLCYRAEPLFYGYHPACWRAWPEGWVPCNCECLEELDPSAAESMEPVEATGSELIPEPVPVSPTSAIDPSQDLVFRLPPPADDSPNLRGYLQPASAQPNASLADFTEQATSVHMQTSAADVSMPSLNGVRSPSGVQQAQWAESR